MAYTSLFHVCPQFLLWKLPKGKTGSLLFGAVSGAGHTMVLCRHWPFATMDEWMNDLPEVHVKITTIF